MTQPFVAQLRARGDALQLAAAGVPSMTVRVEMPEVWDTVKAVVSGDESVATLKASVLEVLYPFGVPAEFVMKLRGFEMLDEAMSLKSAGATDGSIFLVTFRRRRAVR